MPILTSLKNPDFKVRHFEIISNEQGISIETGLTQSLEQLKDLGVMEI